MPDGELLTVTVSPSTTAPGDRGLLAPRRGGRPERWPGTSSSRDGHGVIAHSAVLHVRQKTPDCVLLCPFHHQVVIHRWGWTLVVNPDGTTTAWNKDKTQRR